MGQEDHHDLLSSMNGIRRTGGAELQVIFPLNRPALSSEAGA
jgi:hypothetical protein